MKVYTEGENETTRTNHFYMFFVRCCVDMHNSIDSLDVLSEKPATIAFSCQVFQQDGQSIR